jgi:hypothetical protein
MDGIVGALRMQHRERERQPGALLEGWPTPLPWPKCPGVYVVSCPSLRRVKIGQAKSRIDWRLKTMQTGCPEPYEFLCGVATYDPLPIESALHRACAAERQPRTEWFRMDGEVLRWVRDIRAKADRRGLLIVEDSAAFARAVKLLMLERVADSGHATALPHISAVQMKRILCEGAVLEHLAKVGRAWASEVHNACAPDGYSRHFTDGALYSLREQRLVMWGPGMEAAHVDVLTPDERQVFNAWPRGKDWSEYVRENFFSAVVKYGDGATTNEG